MPDPELHGVQPKATPATKGIDHLAVASLAAALAPVVALYLPYAFLVLVPGSLFLGIKALRKSGATLARSWPAILAVIIGGYGTISMTGLLDVLYKSVLGGHR